MSAQDDARTWPALNLPAVERRSIGSNHAPTGGSGATAPSDPVSGPSFAGAGGISDAAEAVVARWNPHGLALLRAMSWDGEEAAAAVTLVGSGDVNQMLLRVELSRFEPHVDMVEPRTAADGPAAVDGPSSGDEALGADVSDRAAVGDAETLGRDGKHGGIRRRPVPVALVVLDAGSPIGGDGLQAVHELWADGTRVVFALDGIHAHREWRAVLERDVALLTLERDIALSGGAALADVEVVPVSARMAAVARVGVDGALLDRSGLGLLHARLVAAVGAGALVDQGVIVRDRVVDETRARIEGQLEKLRGSGDVVALREERATLLAVGDGGRGVAMSTLRNRLQLARVDLVHEVGARVRALNMEARAEAEGRPNRADIGHFGRLASAVEDLTREMDRVIRKRVEELSAQVEVSAGGSGWEIAEAACQAARVVQPCVGAGPERRRRGLEDRLMVALGASAGFGLGRFVVAPLAVFEAFDWAIVPVGLVLGAAVAWWVVRARGQLAERAHVQQWVSDTLVNVKAQLEQRVATALVEAEERLAEEVVGATTERMVETDRRVGELEAQLRQAAQRRPALTAACERDLAALEFA
ncbi:hypothetical protein H0264_00255 [Nocardia huaxiensis]|uniref:Dynamin family protein n=1 Tax=Nocardia huaxiensis TaxID=2755382 RepID=A0A7D6ZHT9_9NOCA|nr:hypothetical protein [Nocardia huaxiensis]QLY30887.1 hypothetical protein H0264_00255 [Nocardia huaxiensis]